MFPVKGTPEEAEGAAEKRMNVKVVRPKNSSRKKWKK